MASVLAIIWALYAAFGTRGNGRPPLCPWENHESKRGTGDIVYRYTLALL